MRPLFPAVCILAVILSPALPAATGAQIVAESSVQERKARAGEEYTGTIRVRNNSAETQEAKVYLTDYQFFADGRNLFSQAGSTERSNARWIRLPARITVPARGEALVRYTVSVPRDSAGLHKGAYWSTLMIEGIPLGSAASTRRSAGPTRIDVGIQTLTRYAIQVVTCLPGGTPQAQLSSIHVVTTSAGKALELDIVNTGTAAYRLALTLELYDRQGGLAGKLVQPRGLLFPGGSIRQHFALPTLPHGDYKAFLVADTGTEDVFGAQYRLRL